MMTDFYNKEDAEIKESLSYKRVAADVREAIEGLQEDAKKAIDGMNEKQCKEALYGMIGRLAALAWSESFGRETSYDKTAAVYSVISRALGLRD